MDIMLGSFKEFFASGIEMPILLNKTFNGSICRLSPVVIRPCSSLKCGFLKNNYHQVIVVINVQNVLKYTEVPTGEATCFYFKTQEQNRFGVEVLMDQD